MSYFTHLLISQPHMFSVHTGHFLIAIRIQLICRYTMHIYVKNELYLLSYHMYIYKFYYGYFIHVINLYLYIFNVMYGNIRASSLSKWVQVCHIWHLCMGYITFQLFCVHFVLFFILIYIWYARWILFALCFDAEQLCLCTGTALTIGWFYFYQILLTSSILGYILCMKEHFNPYDKAFCSSQKM